MPLTTMTIFGQCGWRTGQCRVKYITYIINTWLFCGFVFVCFSNIHFTAVVLSSPEFNTMRKLSYIGYTFVITVMFGMWEIILLKKNDLACLLQHILHIRRHSLTKTGFLAVIIMLTLFLAINCNISLIIMVRVDSLFGTNDKVSVRYLLYLELLISTSSSWMLVLNISLLICVISIILSREFKKSLTTLEEHLKENKILDIETLYTTTERFREVTSVVNEMDEMFSGVVGVILTIALSCLCVAVYSVLSGQSPVSWYIGGIYSTVTIAMLLPSLSSLNYQVSRNDVF